MGREDLQAVDGPSDRPALREAAAVAAAACQGMAGRPGRAAAGGKSISCKGDADRGNDQSCRDTQ